ncbi:hypothetical protein V6Z11_D05G348800 [Gossypium hirsutum]
MVRKRERDGKWGWKMKICNGIYFDGSSSRKVQLMESTLKRMMSMLLWLRCWMSRAVANPHLR